jgi:hypothetical protein
MCVCVCMYVPFTIRLSVDRSYSDAGYNNCVYMYVCMCICMYVCMKDECMYVCVCMYVCTFYNSFEC